MPEVMREAHIDGNDEKGEEEVKTLRHAALEGRIVSAAGNPRSPVTDSEVGMQARLRASFPY